MPILTTVAETKAAWEAFVRPRVASLMDPETDVLFILRELQGVKIECSDAVFKYTKHFYYMYEALRCAASYRCDLTDIETGKPCYTDSTLVDVESCRVAGGFPSFDVSDGPRAVQSLYRHSERVFATGGYWDAKIVEAGE